jgi:hypothetical protein
MSVGGKETEVYKNRIMRKIWRNNGLTIVLLTIFILTLAGQWIAGGMDYNNEQKAHHLPQIGLVDYLATGHFWQATAENWESEFLQMGCFVIFTIFLYQKGSPESKDPDINEPVNVDPSKQPPRPNSPWPVKRGGFALWLYSHSLSLAFFGIFFFCFALHIVAGHYEYIHSEMLEGQPRSGVREYLSSGRFWFESMQNWQSEFLSLAAMVYLSVYLRQRGSAESKPVAAGHDDFE